MNISLTYPTIGTTINRPTTMVRGTFTSDADEISIKVNGIAAEIYGNQFVINNVPLVYGDNVIIVNGVDSNGGVGRAEIAVKADLSQPHITLSANITNGISPVTSYFLVSTETPNPIVNYQIDFNGDGVIDYTGETFENITYTYTTVGVYYPTVMVSDDKGKTYTASIAIVVLNKTHLELIFKGKWAVMKAALFAGNIESALNYFVEPSKDMYRNVFIQMGSDKINSRFSSIFDLSLDILYGKLSECGALRNEDGVVFSYPVTFIKDGDGIWKMMGF
jgi:PKD repeat protein